ncbi:hypothetical protein K469DRAFT_739282 [Zopfia rhizophila CBS 207.26]|uniref:PH domain-containing protein n=1 Tax=Zopfia rhizophila CBS 207.26 TaxID=1314779 RepID=A0A6A6E2E7_9PEZI|nr:hypothetical protein K469DRAFT_739282 [Zopfia rhizophila CBS 207.26]
METVSAAIGVMVAIPQCITTAKELYDLRSRYKDASVLITAIYSESMVIAASLSQVQTLLQDDALQDKPELHETFDRALTGCRVVYGCLEEEVRELAQKAQSEELGRVDRVRYLLKEETFKELLQQIRGQQSALSLLIQGLQMESIAEIRKLVQNNSVTLEKVATRSKSLRLSHPSVRVPNSIFDKDSNPKNLSDAQSILSQAEFTFDDEVVNSRAYRRAMALATTRAEGKEPVVEVIDGGLINLNSYNDATVVGEEQVLPEAVLEDLDSVDLAPVLSEEQKEGNEETPETEDASEEEGAEDHADLLSSLERNLLPFMPPMPSTTPKPVILTTEADPPKSEENDSLSAPSKARLAPGPLHNQDLDENPPPLPPRRPSQPPYTDGRSVTPSSNKRSSLSGDSASVFSAPSVISNASTSSQTLSESLPTPDEPSVGGKRITKFRRIFYEPVVKKWPVLEKHLEIITIGEQLAPLHRQYLLGTMTGQISQKSFATCSPTIFEAWARKSHALYRTYCQRVPHAYSAIRLTLHTDPKFSTFIGTLGLSIVWFGKSWEDYLCLPITQLDLYNDKLEQLISLTHTVATPAAKKDEPRLKGALEIVQRLPSSCQKLMEESRKREEVQSLYRRIHTLDSSHLAQLNLVDATRKIIHQGGLAIKVNGHGSWQAIHAVLLDNYLFWGKVKPPKSWKRQDGKKTRSVLMEEQPIPISDLEIILPDNDSQFQRATIMDDVPRGSVLYQLFVKDKNSSFQPHTFGAFELSERQEWADQLNTATIAHATQVAT